MVMTIAQVVTVYTLHVVSAEDLVCAKVAVDEVVNGVTRATIQVVTYSHGLPVPHVEATNNVLTVTEQGDNKHTIYMNKEN